MNMHSSPKSVTSNTSAGEKKGKGPVIQRLKRETVSAQLHHSLRQRIVTLELEPGQFLSRQNISEEYGISQTPVRDALIKLEEEGLIATFPQSKTEVSRIDVEHALGTHFLRLSLEIEVAKRLVRAANQSNTDKAMSIVTIQKDAIKSGDIETFARLDRDFHLALYEAAGVQSLYSVIEARSGHIDRLRNLNLPDPGKTQSILTCHRKIIEAINDQNEAAAEDAVREHLSGTLAKVEDIRQRHPDYF